MKKAFLLVLVLFVSVISTACINNLAVQELNNKAKSYLESGDYENAISRLKSSIDLDNTIFETHYNLGIAYTQAEKYPEAVETLKNALKLRPDFTDAYYSIAVAQENFAKGIIDGTIDVKGVAVKADDKRDSVNDSEEEASSKPKEISQESKDKVVELFNDAITSYTTYLEKGKDIEDKEDVQQKIDYLKVQIPKYSPEAMKTES